MTNKKKAATKQGVPKGKTISTEKETVKLPLYLGFLLFITFIIFSPALKNELVSWDDYAYIVDTPLIKDLSWKNIQHMFSFDTHLVGNYHPLTVLTLAIEYKLNGVKPFLFHFDNILLHLLNILLVAYIVKLLCGKLYTVLITSALYALHPLRVESVVWAAERKDVLYAFFFFLSMITYIKYITGNKQKLFLYLLSLFFFALSILSKGQAVVLAGVLVLLDYWFSDNFQLGTYLRKEFLNKIPFIVLAIFFGIMATKAQSSSLTEQRLLLHPLSHRILVAHYNILAYLYKLLFPYSLACFYGYPPKSEMSLLYLSPILLIALMAFVGWRFRNNKTIMFGCLFFLGTIVVVIQLLPIGDAIIADRYTYVPYFGLFFMIASLLQPILEKKALRNRVLTGCSVILLLFAGKSFMQAQTWKNSESVFLTVLKNNPKEPVAHNNLGVYYMDQKNYPKSIDHLQQCIDNRETYMEVYKAYSNLGKALTDMSQNEKAVEAYTQAVQIAPTFIEGYFGRGLSYTNLKQYDKAVADFDQVLQLQPNHAQACYSRGIANRNAGRLDEAINDYTKAIAVNPSYSDAYTNRGNVYFFKGNPDAAIENYKTALQLNPNDGNTWLNLSKNFYVKQNIKEAIDAAQKAANLNVKEEAYFQELNKAGQQ